MGNDVLHVNRSINSFLSSSISFSVFEKKKSSWIPGWFLFSTRPPNLPHTPKKCEKKKRKNFRLTIGSALHQLEQGDERQAGEEPEPRSPARPLHFWCVCLFSGGGISFTNKNSPILKYFFSFSFFEDFLLLIWLLAVQQKLDKGKSGSDFLWKGFW